MRPQNSVPDSGFKLFRCNGCGKYDVTCWNKQGLDHTSCEPGPRRICGQYEYAGPYDGQPGRSDASRDAEFGFTPARLPNGLCVTTPSPMPGFGSDIGRLMSMQLKHPSTRAAAVRRIKTVFRKEHGNAVHSATKLGVSHRALMGWIALYPELREALDAARKS